MEPWKCSILGTGPGLASFCYQPFEPWFELSRQKQVSAMVFQNIFGAAIK